jgi:hypothetical protein
MTFKPKVWRPIAFGASIINLVAVGFAAASTEPWHAAVHAALALGFGLWAQRLQPDHRRSELPGSLEALGGEIGSRLEALEGEISSLGRELSEAQERLDFAERVLAQRSDARSLGPER